MKKKTFTNVVLLTLVLILGLAATAWAGPMGKGMGGGWAANLTPEQSAKIFELKQKFMNDAAPLRQQMLQKRTELAALWQAPTPDQAKIAAKQKELNVLRDQMQQKRLDFQMQVRQIAPNAPMGMGPKSMLGRTW
ncbi:MAG: Spy/CpxP family protein refolding chaperone [Desulfobacca sp.]|uniref:Spy/CpxP family protein refolding chaperone n=1 Tax=Desulfobacca sp. TaxID=2067990 RepID=UPI0040491670